MADDTVNIEVDGTPMTARKGQMLIQVTDAAGVYVPRFCYHKKLTVAANCRMCLVEVEKAPKPLPACATPVMEGMKVKTRSKLAMEAQKSVMEFLLINHPLDCPICDQGGECELQDLAMGFGRDISRYQENKRVVKDKNIGPLVQTDMTRCIHCTRCVRFGEEIAGMRELGATGRGEYMEIGTFVEKSMTSELSGNVIDVCPVGALTSKPFRFSARTWEMSQHPGIAPHDGIGSNVHFHVKDGRVKRVVPADNEEINEVWLSDRDRFSYEGMYSPDRLTTPMVREDGAWREVDWQTAFAAVRDQLGPFGRQGAAAIGGLISATASTEELFLFQKLVRALGSHNVDHRLQQLDFSDQDAAPAFPWLGLPIADLEQLQSALIIGGHPRKEQPLLNHRLRKAALRGGKVMFINPVDWEMNYPTGPHVLSGPWMVRATAAVLRALLQLRGGDAGLEALLGSVQVGEPHRQIAERLVKPGRGAVLLGKLAEASPQASTLRFLAGTIASLSGAAFGYLGAAANSSGAWLAGAVPHRLAGGQTANSGGLHAQAMLERKLPAYLLFNVELDADCANAPVALAALGAARCVIAMTPFRNALAVKHAHVMLPIALYAENEGTYINVEGRAQSFAAAVKPPGEARAGWKVLRMVAGALGLDGFKFDSVADIGGEFDMVRTGVQPSNANHWRRPDRLSTPGNALQRVTHVPMNAADPLVRRAPALQQTIDAADHAVHINGATAKRLGLDGARSVVTEQNGASLRLPLAVDEMVADGIVLIHGGHPGVAALGPWFGEIALRRA